MDKTIAIFSGYYLPFLGGVERYTDKLMLEMKKKNYKIIIVTTKYDDLLKDYEVNDEGFEIFRLPVYNLFKSRYPIIKKNSEYKIIMKELEKRNIDFIACQTRFHLTTLVGLKYAKKFNIPSMVLEHGSDHFTVNNKFLDWFGAIYEHMLTWRLKKLTDNFYAVSKRSTSWLEHFKIRSRGVIYNSVDETIYDSFKNKKFKHEFKNKLVITYAGRIIKEKGVEMLLKSFMSLANTENIELVIAGDGPILDELKKQYKQRNILFVGKLDFDDTITLLNRTDIFCYPSMYPEGLPTSILEAGIMKCAVIATDRGGTVEVINSPDYGIIIEENQDSLTSALEKLINDENYRDSIKENLHERIENNFTWKVTSEKFENVCNKK
ncbi:glycosyl transferase [Floricoccus tropicus]|uniref:Glycosyl transferase n=1 Tax=Floricoccus tropicus TaxID=1859473 RepID=A0A1E8GM70_9LACT|nr:glycosyltransferase family 4 protein [Floricoccus tropicus]OFI48733.1 glycosyl transferase [Floricoccus tropicus]